MFGSKWDEMIGAWGKFDEELQLHGSYWSQNIIRVIKAWRMRWVRHAVCIEMTNLADSEILHITAASKLKDQIGTKRLSNYTHNYEATYFQLLTDTTSKSNFFRSTQGSRSFR
jgi:hypothetical protein